MTTTPRAIECFPGIWQFVGVNRAAHAYLLRGRRRAVLIDTGLPSTFEHLATGIRQAGLEVGDLDLVILTHEHIDHAGGSIHFDCPIAAHRLAARKLTLLDEFSLMSRAYPDAAAKFAIDLTLEDGGRIDVGGYVLHVLHTPGHCSGAICFYEPSRRILFSGDTIMASGVVGGVLGSGNASDYIESLERLATLRIDHLMGGHGRLSQHAEQDIEKGLQKMHGLIDDSHALFSVMRETQRGHDDILRSLRDLNTL